MKTRFAAVCASVALAASAGAVSSPWVYLPEESVISNNNAVGRSTDWVLNVQVRDAAKRTLDLGGSSAGDAYRLRDDGSFVGGTVLDLSEEIRDPDGNTWTISRFVNRALRRNGSPIVEFVAPHELESMSWNEFEYSGRVYESMTFECPSLTSWPGCGVMNDNLATLVLKIPRVTEIGWHGIYSTKTGVDATDWDLNGLETVKYEACYWARLGGTLRMPNVKTIEYSAFGALGLTRLELGNRHNSLVAVGANAFSGSSRAAELVTGGGGDGWTVATNAFALANLERVWMTGSVPTFEEGGLAFGTANHAEKSMVFYVPDTAAWAAVRAGATALTEEEIAAFTAAHPDWKVPFGVVAADVFHTQNAQYIGTADLSTLGFTCRVAIGSRSEGQYGDSWTVTVDGEEVTDGEVPYGADVTVTAKPAKDTTQVAWEGMLPDGTVPTGNAFTFRATDNVSVMARFIHAWEFDAEAVPQTITDGYWTLVVTNTADRSLQVGVQNAERGDGRTKDPWAFPADIDAALKGELDLSGPVYTKGCVGDEEARWTIATFSGKAFGSDGQVTSFYAPTTGFSDWGSQVFNGAYAVTNTVLNCPDMTNPLFPWAYEFSSCPIDRLVLNLPNLTKIGSNTGVHTTNFRPATFASSDLAEWDLSSLTFVSPKGLQAGAANGVGPKGDLVLPNLERLCDGAFHNWRRVTSAALGTNGTLKTLGAYLFANNTDTLKKLDFGTSSAFTVSNTTFLAAEDTPLPVEEVWFAGKAPSVEALDNILALRTVAEDGTKPVKIFAPMMDATWKAVCTSFTDEEATVARTMRKEQNLRVIGVDKTQAGRRVAWLVQNPAFPYRSGFVITIRGFLRSTGGPRFSAAEPSPWSIRGTVEIR